MEQKENISFQGKMILMQNISPKILSFNVMEYEKRYGHDVFVGFITYDQLIENCMFLPEVQRKTNPKRVEQIAKVILEQAEAKEACRMINPNITGTLSGSAQYRKPELTVDFSQEKISVNDGSHRTQGVILAVDTLKKRIDKVSEDDAIILRDQLNKLLKTQFIITFYVGLSRKKQRLLFLNLNAGQKPVPNSKIVDFDSYSPITKLANHVANLDFIKSLGVETENDRKTKSRIFTKSNICGTICIMLMNTQKFQEVKLKDDYNLVKDVIDNIFEMLFGMDGVLSEKKLFLNTDYILNSPSALKGIGRYIYYVRSRYPNDWKNYVRALKKIEWLESNTDWKGIDKRGGQSMIRNVFKILVEKLVD